MTLSPLLEQQIAFIVEIDRLKSVLRQNYIADGSRRENTAEHSWHVAMLALVLNEHAAQPVDTGRVIELLLVHDLVEIDAGDTFAYDQAGAATQEARERRAAERIFGLLPEAQAAVAQLSGLLQDTRASLRKVDAVLAEAQAVGANVRAASTDLGALRAEVEANLRKIDTLLNQVNRTWPFARDPKDLELTLP